jgi:hypothetical protein
MEQKFKLITGCFSKKKEINILSAKKYNIEPNKLYENIDSLIKYEKKNIDFYMLLVVLNQLSYSPQYPPKPPQKRPRPMSKCAPRGTGPPNDKEEKRDRAHWDSNRRPLDWIRDAFTVAQSVVM